MAHIIIPRCQQLSHRVTSKERCLVLGSISTFLTSHSRTLRSIKQCPSFCQAKNRMLPSIVSTSEKENSLNPVLLRKQFFTTASRIRMPGVNVLEGFNETQVKLMEEECILVDTQDKKVGSASKKICHLLENINKGMLHRAFSVFLFNSKGDLLLQQRADEKITFPNHFTNTCCSHPLNFEAELDETEAIGVKKAAQRKLKHELGIKPEQIPLEDFHYLTRILYKAENVPKDNVWGEHEIDYVLIIKRDVDIVCNTNEVKSYRYVSQQELKDIFANADKQGIILTPWFQLICNKFLYKWWDNLDNIESQADRDTIHNMV